MQVPYEVSCLSPEQRKGFLVWMRIGSNVAAAAKRVPLLAEIRLHFDWSIFAIQILT